MSGHTPGPWHFVGDQRGNIDVWSDSAAYRVATAHKAPEGREDAHAQRDANAALIAAAPDLLEELRAARGYVCAASCEGEEPGEHSARCRSIGDAIAKARGGK